MLPAHGTRPGKGEALWKSLAATTGDLVVFLDADLIGDVAHFVPGLLGPLLTDPQVLYVKGCYTRPLELDGDARPAGGGRVTELTARPLLNALWPELAGFVQPLGGEYAGRRSALERVPFVSGYGVEVGLLVDLLELGGLAALAQVDLGVRRHTSQSDEALGTMAGQVVSTVLARAGSRRPGQRAAGRQRAAHPVPPRRDARSCPAAAPSPSTSGRRWRRSPSTAPARPGWPADGPMRPHGLGRARVASRGGVRAREDHRVPTAPSSPPVTEPEVVAHRGATAEAPEHTLAAYRHAAAIGADAVECDVRMTRDGVLVCVHDRQIRSTSNGRGVVSALHLRELEQFHFGARRRTGRSRWADDEIRAVSDEPDVENGLVLTLDRLLEYITATPGTVRLAIETKHPTRHASKVEEELVELPAPLRAAGPRRAGRVGGQAGRAGDELLAARGAADARPGARGADRAADRQAAAGRPPRAAGGLGDGDGPRHRPAAVRPGVRRRRPRGRQGAARLDGQPAPRHGPRVRARRRRGDHRPSRTSCCAGSAASPTPP